jgi:2-polyprenyl-3-methyl-5-hydroxy-6-metoxy-1,4-benzoquinol methylase
MSRIESTVQDLIGLGCQKYCDPGPGKGAISTGLSAQGRAVIGVEAPWANASDFPWADEHGIKIYYEEFFTGDLKRIGSAVDCFVLAHCIAHFRFSPYVLFKKIHDALPGGGVIFTSPQ